MLLPSPRLPLVSAYDPARPHFRLKPERRQCPDRRLVLRGGRRSGDPEPSTTWQRDSTFPSERTAWPASR